MPSNHDDATAANREPTRPLAGQRLRPHLSSVDPDAFRAATRRLLAAGVVLLVLGLLALLPGLDRTVPRTPLPLFSLAVGVGTLVLVRMLVGAAGDLETVVGGALDGPAELQVTAGVVAKHLVVLLAVLVAYRGLAGVFVPLLAPGDTVWVYDLAFLVLSAVPTAFVAYYLYRALDPSAAHLTRRVVGTDDDRQHVDGDAPAVDGAGDDPATESGDDEPAR